MAISTTKTFGLSDQVVQFLEDNQADLLAKGYDVSDRITEINNLREDAVVETTKQDDMTAALKVQTKTADAKVDLLYNATSTTLDAAIGVLGKTTPLAKQAGKLRSSLIKQTKKNSGNGGNP